MMYFRVNSKSLKKEFIINLMLLLLANMLVKPLYIFGIDRNVQLIVGTENYGDYISLLNFTFILQFVNDFGLQNWVNRTIGQQTSHTRSIYSQILSLKIILAFGYFGLTMILGYFWFLPENRMHLLIQLALNQFLVSSIFFLRASISGLGFYKTDSLLSILDRLILIIVCGVFIWNQNWVSFVDIQWFASMQTLSLILVFIICVLLLIKENFKFKFHRIRWDEIKYLLNKSFPFALVYLFYVLLTKSDGILLVKLLKDGSFQAGCFSASMRLYEAGTMISLVFAGLLISMFSRNASDTEKLTVLLKTSWSILWVITVSVSLWIIFNRVEINRYLYPNSTVSWDQMLGVLMVGFIPGSMNFILGAYFQALHKEQQLWKLYACLAILALLINSIQVLYYGAIGSAFVFSFFQWILLIIQICQTEMKEKIYRPLLIKSLLFLMINFSMMYCLSEWYYGNFWIEAFISFGLQLITSLVLGLIQIQEFKHFAKLRSV